MKQSPPAPGRLCVPVLRLGLQNKQGKSQKSHLLCNSLSFAGPIAMCWCPILCLFHHGFRGLQNKKIPANLLPRLLQGVPRGGDAAEGGCSLAASLRVKRLLQSPKIRGGRSTGKGKKKKRINEMPPWAGLFHPCLPGESRAETRSLPRGLCRGLQGGEKTALPWLCLFLLEQTQKQTHLLGFLWITLQTHDAAIAM